MKEKIGKLDFIKLKMPALSKIMLRKLKARHRPGKKWFHVTCLIKILYPRYIKEISKLIGKQTTRFFFKQANNFK